MPLFSPRGTPARAAIVNAQPPTTVQLGPITLQPVPLTRRGGSGTVETWCVTRPWDSARVSVTGNATTPYMLDAKFDEYPPSTSLDSPNPPGAWGSNQNNAAANYSYTINFVQIVVASTYWLPNEPHVLPVLDTNLYVNGTIVQKNPLLPSAFTDQPKTSQQANWYIGFADFVVATPTNVSGMMILSGFTWTVGHYAPTSILGFTPPYIFQKHVDPPAYSARRRIA